jgi:hypothetical protein
MPNLPSNDEITRFDGSRLYAIMHVMAKTSLRFNLHLKGLIGWRVGVQQWWGWGRGGSKQCNVCICAKAQQWPSHGLLTGRRVGFVNLG